MNHTSRPLIHLFGLFLSFFWMEKKMWKRMIKLNFHITWLISSLHDLLDGKMQVQEKRLDWEQRRLLVPLEIGRLLVHFKCHGPRLDLIHLQKWVALAAFLRIRGWNTQINNMQEGLQKLGFQMLHVPNNLMLYDSVHWNYISRLLPSSFLSCNVWTRRISQTCLLACWAKSECVCRSQTRHSSTDLASRMVFPDWEKVINLW